MAGLLNFLEGVGQGLASQSPEAKKQRESDVEMANYEKKLRLQQELAMQLEERKLKLAEQFPQMKQAISTPYGAIFTFDKSGKPQQAYVDEDVRGAYIEGQKAKANLSQAKAEVEPSRARLNDAKAEAEPIKAGAAVTAAERSTGRSTQPAGPKPLTAVQQTGLHEKARKRVIEAMPGGSPRSKLKAFNALTPVEQNTLIEKEKTRAAPAASGINYDDPYGDITNPQ